MNLEQLQAWRQDAIRRMRQRRSATLRFLKEIPASEIRRPRTQGRWSIKDVFAHIVAWEEEAVRRLEKIIRGQADKIIFYDDMREVDRFNARAVAAQRGTPWRMLLRRAAQVRERLVERLSQLPLEALNDPAQRYPVVAWLPEFAWTHERDHIERIRKWWKKRSSRQQQAGGRSGGQARGFS